MGIKSIFERRTIQNKFDMKEKDNDKHSANRLDKEKTNSWA